MQRKTMMGLAAVAAIAALIYMRKRGADSQAAGTSGVLSSNAALLNAAMGNASNNMRPISVTVSGKAPAPAVADTTARSPAPAVVPTFGGGGGAPPPPPAAQGGGGKPVHESYAFGHVSDEQRAGRTDAEMIAGMLW